MHKACLLQQKLSDWFLFTILSLIWGSSFILMKIGLQGLNAYQVATIRILSAGIVLLPFAPRAFKKVPRNKLSIVFISGLCGSFFPAYCYCIAETKIDSSLAAILNALTPLFAILIGLMFFKLSISKRKIVGVLIGFSALCLLPFASKTGVSYSNISFSFLVLIATIFYGINANLISFYLKKIGSLNIAAVSFTLLIIPCMIILLASAYFSQATLQKSFLQSTAASCVLGIGGTAIATVLYYKLVKSAGAVFASLVTYGIPFVAILWGLLAGETITGLEDVCLIIILCGVYLAN